ncbi:MAG: exopolysaccharide biosynthesis protein [Pirellulaceae bacterium]|nr:exopolysaccharide biosynthesis protein [Pirellulaceae bacterium]
MDWFASLSISELLRSVWQQRMSVIAVSAAMSVLLALVVFLLPVKYDSDAQLLVRLGRNTLSSDPTSNVTPNVSVQETRVSQVNSVKEMLQSRALAHEIVQQVGAERILEPHGLVETITQSLMGLIPSLGGGGGGDGSDGSLTPEEAVDHLRQEEAIAKLQNNIEFTTAKNAYTVHVRVRSGSPYLSQELLTSLIERYQIYHVNAYRSGGALDFFETQTNQAYEQAVATKEKVRQAKDSMGVIEIESARAALREQLSQAQRELDQVAVDLAATTSEVLRYQQEMKATTERVKLETVNGITSNTGDGIRQQLYQLELQAKELGAKLREDHPALKAIREQLDAATRIAASERKEQPQSREAINPVYQQLEISYRSALVRKAGLEARQGSLSNHLVDLDKKIFELNKNEVELTKLHWEATLAENVYLQNAQSRDKAKLLDALDTQGLTEISVVQPASLQLKKASPKRGLLLVACLMLAGSMGVMQALVRAVLARMPQPPQQGPGNVEQVDIKPRLVSEMNDEDHYTLRVPAN